MDSSSPSKRHALAPIAANTRVPATVSRSLDSKPVGVAKSQVLPTTSTTSTRIDRSPAKRPLDQDLITTQQGQHNLQRQLLHQYAPVHPAKRRRTSADEVASSTSGDQERGARAVSCSHNDSNNRNYDCRRQQSDSSDEDSTMDNSAIDTSQDTTITEPDTEGATPTPLPVHVSPRQQSGMTREEARRAQKAETLRLRLSLASYKLRTGQTDVPLEQLEAKSLLRSSRREEEQQQPPTLPPLPLPRSAMEDVKDECEWPTAPFSHPKDGLLRTSLSFETKALADLAISSLRVSQELRGEGRIS
ncbi:hypothetical protein AAE478_002791 [Parahypoxylon ruwenzoriense]